MNKPEYLFEISWEVCNMVGGIYTVISTKANEVKQQLGDKYITIGPDVVKEAHETPYFIEDPMLFAEWREKAAAEGLRVRVGRWKINSKPIAILIDYTTLFTKKDEILGHLWEQYQLDSISGQWDYIEPVLFGYASGYVIESFMKWNMQRATNVVANFHEWMTGAGILYLKEKCPEVATVFTTHATYLGRAISGNGLPLYSNLNEYNPAVMASRFNIVAQQSMESKAAQNADTFTTVSDITAQECKQFLNREPDVLTINGIDDSLIQQPENRIPRRVATRKKILTVLEALSGTKIDEDAFLIITSGRYEYKNKGIDLFIEAISRLNQQARQRPIVAVIAVPANIAGPSKDLTRRLKGETPIEGHTDFPATHHIFEYEHDTILNALRNHGLQNGSTDSVKVMFVPSYLNGNDGIFNINYSDFLSGFDLSVFPSYYEPWGYTPLESVASGIPTITTDLSGFGLYVNSENHNTPAVAVIHRTENNSDEVIGNIVTAINYFSQYCGNEKCTISEEAISIAKQLNWKKLFSNYLEAYDVALSKLEGRAYLLQTKQYSEVLRTFNYQKQDEPNWKKFMVQPVYSQELKKLQQLARNLWWSWNDEAIDLFRSIDPQLWNILEHNPVMLMESLSKFRIDELENDSEFIARLNKVYKNFEDYMSVKPQSNDRIAYFSMEYGLTKSLKIYSGGLGILAGDYLKQASDSNANMVAIGLLYRYGYFTQRLSVNGEQISDYIPQKFSLLPLDPLRDEKGDWVMVSIAFPGRSVYAKAWRVNVGRISLYLLDTDIDKNNPDDRTITSRLYGGDNEMRLKQEMFLGIGGVRLIDQLNLKPTIFHCNEGHAAFSGLERLQVYINRHNLSFDVAKELVRTSTLFTTHTPVPAGHDAFEEHLIRTYMPHYANRMNISWDDFMNLGRFHKNDQNDKFSMSVLATNLSQEVNGVSKIHGRVSREMFQQLWPGYYAEELFIGSVTNGVHLPTWADKNWQKLYYETFGADFLSMQSDAQMWKHIAQVPDEKIWNIRIQLKHQLVEYLKEKVKFDMQARQENPALVSKTIENLNENALIIGFARRFATYKRAHLLFTNLERLSNIVNNPQKPVVFLFAGKAHPNDKAGQDLIKMIIEVSRRPEFAGKVLFLENYDMELGKILTSSVDIWLNTPTRPLEASGTSGEKAVMNGTLNFSVLDGWWAEGYKPDAGWAIEEQRTYQDQKFQDMMDAETIYNLLENNITNRFFTRNANDVPEDWVKSIKKNLSQIAPEFTMKRMIDDYFALYYNKLIERTNWMRENRYQKAFEITAWKNKIKANWNKIEVLSIKVPDPDVRPLNFGDMFIAEITLKIHGLDASDVGVEILFGDKENDQIKRLVHVEKLKLVDSGEGWAKYYLSKTIFKAGVYNYTFRIFPDNAMLPHRQDLALVKWI